MFNIRSIIALAALLGDFVALAANEQAPVSFEKDIRPIFREHCYRCHGATQQKAGLRLDLGFTTTPWAGESGPILQAGSSASSRLIRLLHGEDEAIAAMPYKSEPLSSQEIERLTLWVDQGASIPKDLETDSLLHWSFIPPSRPKLPSVNQDQWPKNPIDFFILARLEAEGLTPSHEAAPETLLRRIHLDLLGIPPTEMAVRSVGSGWSESDYQGWVLDLLQSPHHGERWGRHWLDVARYADSNGYSIDGERTMWRYRDWVIEAINTNMPFDEFVIEQLAGDLLPHATQSQRIATGFHRNTQINQEGGIDPEQFRMESVFDRVATTGSAFLGLTLGCAQCHDHKFDPISQEEYYQLFSFFNNQDEPNIPAPTHQESLKLAEWEARSEALNQEMEAYEQALPDKILNWEKFFNESDTETAPEDIAAILNKLPSQRNEQEVSALQDAFRKHDKAHAALLKRQAEMGRKRPRVTTAMVLKERENPRQSHLLIKGDFTRPDQPVAAGVPAVLHPLEDSDQPTRLNLARWLVSNKNPLMARVVVNRIWQQYFGVGIVQTENDFGTQGTPPSHPELLDWLACEFMESGWDLKHMHRLITTSAVYRQSSNLRPELMEKDARNLLLARQNRMRLDSEIVRDVALHATGLLERTIGGPSVRPPQPEGVMTLGQVQRKWRADSGENRYRRGMYTFHYRATPHPALSVFDSPDAFSSCTRRIRSNTPLQALTLLNDPAFYEMAEALGKTIASWNLESDEARLTRAFQRCTSRLPSPEEKSMLLDFITREKQRMASSSDSSSEVWLSLARVLLNLDETITRE